ncbi:MAG: hypothetical protein P8Z78_11765 [Gammaproteobacteria bacterium]
MNKKYWIVTVLAVAVLGYAAATIYVAPDEPGQTATAEQSGRISTGEAGSKADDLMTAQGYSTRCATPNGTCTLDRPKRVGSLCECPGMGSGTVVR